MKGATFPLKKAYPFLRRHGLGREADAIGRMPVEWDLSYTSSVRRGYIIALLRKQGLLDQFIEECWRQGLTPAGRREIEFRLNVARRYQAQSGGQHRL